MRAHHTVPSLAFPRAAQIFRSVHRILLLPHSPLCMFLPMDYEVQESDCPSFLTSWLATQNDWLDPTKVQQQQQQDLSSPPWPSPSLPAPTTPVSPPSRYHFTRGGRKRKRPRSSSSSSRMNHETTSNASRESARTATTSASSFHNRPILDPTPPSTRQRSPSPTRRVLSQLRLATPSLRVCQPDIRLVQPPMVKRLRGLLMKEVSSGVIPRSLEVNIISLL